MNQPMHVTEETFDAEVLQSETPVLVDYWAEWCGPCRSLAPTIDVIADDYGNRLKVVKVDIDANSAIPARFGIRSIPTLMLFKNAEVVGTKVGAISQNELAAFVDDHM